jgi:phosphoglycolate phosphatase
VIFKAIIFDLDGTLADTISDVAGSMNRVLKAHRFPLHRVTEYKLLVGRGLDNLVVQALPESARKPGLVSKCLAEMMEDYGENCLVNTCLYKGIKEMLIELALSNVKLAVFSNKTESLTRKIVKHLLGDIPFFVVMGARSDLPKKPDPAGALSISRKMDVHPEEMMYVGDSDVDMITATRAGMHAAGVLWGFRTGEELLANGAKTLLEKPSDLLNFFFVDR